MPREKSTSTYCGVLFCEDPTHEEAIRRVFKYYDYFIIKHKGEDYDDIPFEADEGAEPINTKGKDHWHFVIIFPYSVKRKYIAESLGITENYIQNCSSRKGYIRYLTHRGDRKKTQYCRNDFNTNRPILLDVDLRGLKEPEELPIEMMDIIQNKNWRGVKYDEYISFLFKAGFSTQVRQYSKQIDNLYITLSGRPIYDFRRKNDYLIDSFTGEIANSGIYEIERNAVGLLND